MARIAGNFGAGPGARLAAQLAAVRAAPSWRAETRDVPGGALGACGRDAPACAGRGPLQAVLDGWIFNRGEFDKAANDAELLLDLVERHGVEGALGRINGDFAIAVHDAGDGSLWLARDRFGIRPLYYAETKGGFAFASRPAGLFAMPGVSRDVNRRWVAVFAASHYRYIDNRPDESPYAAVRQLPAASLLRWKNGRAEVRRYWELRDGPDVEGTEADLAARYRELLMDAVRIRLGAAERAAFTLSGGMDSSSVLACAVEQGGGKQHAFSTTYRDKTYDESAEIRSMLETKVSEWHQVLVEKPDVFGLVAEMVRCHDEPVATATWLSHYVLCREVRRQGYGGLFGGLGGDELNAGEYEYYFFNFADLRLAGCEDELREEVRLWKQYHDHPIYRKDYDVMEEALGRMVDLRRPGVCLPDRRRMARYYEALDPAYFEIDGFVPVLDHPFRSFLKNRTYQDIYRETAPCCLRAEDRQTEAFGLDNFLPFFDHRLVEFMFRVPGRMKIRDGVTKRLLREAMRGVLPEETRTRIKKTGWNAPAHIWFSAERRGELMDLVRSASFRGRGIYDAAEVDRLIAEHFDIVSTGKTAENHMMFFWQLINLELWMRECVDEGSGGRPT